MVGDGKDLAGAGVEDFEAEFLFDAKPPFFAEDAIEMNGRVHGNNRLFGEKNHLDAARLEKGNQAADDGVYLAQIRFHACAGAESLEVVIEMREINQAQRWRIFVFNPLGGFGDPSRDRVGTS